MARNAAWLDAQDQLVYERAVSREDGAPDFIADMNGDIAIAQHTSHAASTLVAPVSDAYDEAQREGGGEIRVTLVYGVAQYEYVDAIMAADEFSTPMYDAAHEDDADSLPVGEADWYPYGVGRVVRTTWLERIEHRFPVRVS